ncbi:NUDIX domain-containing protein [Candidatus Woesearchaeota archaeon]|nr:NUDIX domain-containing protein [Candidatus Woesearchaeota archaeon]
MVRIRTGRAVIRYPIRDYNSVLLVREIRTARYALPGGAYDHRKDGSTLDTAVRELKEELGQGLEVVAAQYLGVHRGAIRDHDIYLMEVTGKVELGREVIGIAFFNSGRENKLPPQTLEDHIEFVRNLYRSGVLPGNRQPGITYPYIPRRLMDDWQREVRSWRQQERFKSRRR